MALVITLPISALLVAVLRGEYGARIQASIEQEQLARQEYLQISGQLTIKLFDKVDIVDKSNVREDNGATYQDELSYQEIYLQVIAQVLDALINSGRISSYRDLANEYNQLSQTQRQQLVEYFGNNIVTQGDTDTADDHKESPNPRFIWLVKHYFYIVITVAFQKALVGHTISLAIGMIVAAITAAVIASGGAALAFSGVFATLFSDYLIGQWVDGFNFYEITRQLGYLMLPEFGWSEPSWKEHYIRI
jgi:hypothetical protein